MSIVSSRSKSGLLCYWDESANAKKTKSRLEKCEQQDLNMFCTKKWPEHQSMMFHVVNEGGTGGGQYGADLKKYGRKKGVPDWLVMIPNGRYHGLYVELKRSRKQDSSISKESREFLLLAESLGYICVIAYGYKPALSAIEEYLNN